MFKHKETGLTLILGFFFTLTVIFLLVPECQARKWDGIDIREKEILEVAPEKENVGAWKHFHTDW